MDEGRASFEAESTRDHLRATHGSQLRVQDSLRIEIIEMLNAKARAKRVVF